MAEAAGEDIESLTEDLKIENAYDGPEQIEQHQKDEELRRGLEPSLTTDIQGLRKQHRKTITKAKDKSTAVGIISTSTHTIDASKVPLKDLKRISLKDLRLEKATKGGYLTLRTLENPYQLVGIITIVEDHEGNSIQFTVFNFTDELNPNLNDLLPIGTVFILKEPCIEISEAKVCSVRCYCPSDMIIVFRGHALFPLVEGITWKNAIDSRVVDPMFSDPVPKTALEWKNRGDALFRANKYEHATRCYLLSLQELTDLDKVGNLEQIVLMNASAAYLQRGFFEKSLEFAQKILEKIPGNKKVLERAGKCCYKLRKYVEAKKYFDECNTLHPDDKDIKKELKKTNDRLLEQAEGKFDIYNMLLTRSIRTQHKFDCADYAGPIKVVDIPGKGRGVVATKDIKPGTLLVVSKALVYVWNPEQRVQVQINKNETADIGSHYIVITHLAQMIAKNPQTFGQIVYDLHVSDNIPVKAGSVQLFCSPETKEEPIVDVERIHAILTANCFCGSYRKPQHTEYINLDDLAQEDESGGLFILPSYFNHKCIPNATWTNINDVMFIRAVSDIKANEEVFLSYVSWRLTNLERQNMFQIRGFQCDCTFCVQERTVPTNIKLKRRSIYVRFEKTLAQLRKSRVLNRTLVRKVEHVLRELLETYNNSEEVMLNPAMYSMYMLIARAYAIDSRTDAAGYDIEIETQYKILRMFSFDALEMLESSDNGDKLISSDSFLTGQVLLAIACLISINNKAGRVDVRNKWMNILVILENVYSGGGIDVLKFNFRFLNDLF